MWINLTKEQLNHIRGSVLMDLPELPIAQEIVREIDERLAVAFDPENEAWVQKAFDIHQDEGTLEVDQQSDGSAIVSHSEDGGAYLMAWVWVSNEDMGLAACEDCGDYHSVEKLIDGFCDNCADPDEEEENDDAA